MQSVGQPDINVEGHAVVGDLLDRSFLDRNRMLLQLFEKSFAQLGGLDKKIALGAIIGDEHGTIEDILVYKPAAAGGGDLKSQAASADPFGLVAHVLHTLAANRDVETLQPRVKATPQLNLAAAGPDRLSLKVEDDEAGA
jgi:hypothetical protein